MTAFEQIEDLAEDGLGRVGVEAEIGHKLEGEELETFYRFDTVRKQIRDLVKQGIGRFGVEAEIGRKMDAEEVQEFYKAQNARKLEIAQKKARGPMSAADRVRKHVASTNDIGKIDPRPRHRRLKEACRYDLEKFMWYYCRRVLKHRPSALIRDGLIHDVQETILHGGKAVKLYGRGTGKTTIIVYCAVTWSLLYGHRRYPVIISATGKLAKKNLKAIKKLISRSRPILQDFPAVAIPIQRLGDVSQRSASQTYCGVPTDVEWAADQVVLPMLRGEDGQPLDAGCGAIVGSVGIGGAVRGSNEGGQRPDFLILDDPQDRKIAHSPKMVEAVINYIHQDALMLAGHDRTISAFVTITPQCLGDVATELCSKTKHPEWDVSIEPFVKHTCTKWSALVLKFVEKYVEDTANHDSRFTQSTKWYIENRDKFASVVVLDSEQYDHATEVDAIHHVLNLRALLGEEAFNAEIMMKVGDIDSELEVKADLVAERLNGAPVNVCPPGTDSVVAFCDVNITNTRGLSWVAVAFGPNRVAAVVNYGRFPEQGPLVPPNSSDLVRNRLVAAGIKRVVEKVKSLPIRDTRGRRVRITAIGFDRGYLPAVIHRSLFVIRKTQPLPFQLVAMRGFPWDKFGVKEKDTLRRGDHVFATRSKYGQYLAEMAPYWREVMQSSWLETALQPGSISLYGSDSTRHFAFATEICNEKLIRKWQVVKGKQTLTAWDWQELGENHFCDAVTGAFALASWFRLYDDLSKVIDGVLLPVERQPIDNGDGTVTTPSGRTFRTVAGVAVEKPAAVAPHALHQDDLFDPMKNQAILTNAGVEVDTEGTGDVEIAAEGMGDEPVADPLLDASPVRKLSTKLSKRVHKFRRGKYRR